jgi:hypothetical protein
VTKIDITKIDRDFFGFSGLWSEFVNIKGHLYHPFTICLDGIWISVNGMQGGTLSEWFVVRGLYRRGR